MTRFVRSSIAPGLPSQSARCAGGSSAAVICSRAANARASSVGTASSSTDAEPQLASSQVDMERKPNDVLCSFERCNAPAITECQVCGRLVCPTHRLSCGRCSRQFCRICFYDHGHGCRWRIGAADADRTAVVGRSATARRSAQGRLGRATAVAAIAADEQGASGSLVNEPLYFDGASFSVASLVIELQSARATAPCANYGCSRQSVDMCGNCNLHYCASHFWRCGTCRRGPFCDVCVTPVNHSCVPDREPPQP